LGPKAPPISAGEEDSDDSGYRRKLHYQPLKRAVARVRINAEDDLDPFRPQHRSNEEQCAQDCQSHFEPQSVPRLAHRLSPAQDIDGMTSTAQLGPPERANGCTREFGKNVRPNHLGMALQRHRRAGRLEFRDQR